MASSYVMDQLRQWCSGLSLPFYDTINREVNPSDPAWLTIQPVTVIASQADYCHGQHERGTFDLIVLTQGGTGDAIQKQAEADLATLMAQRDPQQRLTLVNAGPFDPFPQPGAARFFTLSAAIDYLYVH